MSTHNQPELTRRIMLTAGLGVAASAVAAGTSAAQTTTKIAKSALMYQDQPKDGHECSQCVNFEPPNACKIVAGTISPHGWCGAWAPKPA